MKLKLKPKNLLIFAITGKQKFKGIYTPTKTSYSDYYDLMPVWVADMSPDCTCVNDGIGLGAKCYLLDAYELNSQVPFKVMQAYGSKVDFKDEILKEANEFGGEVKAYVIHENSLMLMEEDSWKENPKLSWDLAKSERQSSATGYLQ